MAVAGDDTTAPGVYGRDARFIFFVLVFQRAAWREGVSGEGWVASHAWDSGWLGCGPVSHGQPVDRRGTGGQGKASGWIGDARGGTSGRGKAKGWMEGQEAGEKDFG